MAAVESNLAFCAGSSEVGAAGSGNKSVAKTASYMRDASLPAAAPIATRWTRQGAFLAYASSEALKNSTRGAGIGA
jgi:hypothetical protein